MRVKALRAPVHVLLLASAAGCLSTEASERRQLDALARGIEGDRSPVDPPTRVEENVARSGAAAGAPPPPTVVQGERVPESERADDAPGAVVRIWGTGRNVQSSMVDEPSAPPPGDSRTK